MTDREEILALAEKINLSYLVTLNVGGATENHLSADDVSRIIAALRIVGSDSPHLRTGGAAQGPMDREPPAGAARTPSGCGCNMTESEELLSCPFCGGEPELVCGGPGNWYAHCKQCKAAGDDTMRDHARQLWNRRTFDAAQGRPDREAVAQAIKDHTCAGYADDKVLGIYQAADAILALAPAQAWPESITEQDLVERLYEMTSMEGYSDCQRLAHTMLKNFDVVPKAALSPMPSTQSESTTVYLREVDAGTDSACWVICNRVDAGAVAFVGAA